MKHGPVKPQRLKAPTFQLLSYEGEVNLTTLRKKRMRRERRKIMAERNRRKIIDSMGKQPCCVACVASLLCVSGKEVESMKLCHCGRLILNDEAGSRYIVSKECPGRPLARPVENVNDLCNKCHDEFMR